jgi:hypothetical protein
MTVIFSSLAERRKNRKAADKVKAEKQTAIIIKAKRLLADNRKIIAAVEVNSLYTSSLPTIGKSAK